MEIIINGFSAAVCLIFGWIWSIKTWPNFFAKVILVTIGLFNLFLLLQNLGYIIKI